MLKRKDCSQRIVELENYNKQLKLENEALKREITELREINDKLKQSLDEAVRGTKPGPSTAPRGLKATNSQYHAKSDTTDSGNDIELQRQLNAAIQQLSETRQQLLTVKERLTVAEQVTAATQRRELIQEGAYEHLPKTGVYEELRFDPTQEHDYTAIQLTTHTGCLVVFFWVVV